MGTKTLARNFPENEASVIHQDGSHLTVPSKGVRVILHTRDHETAPHCAELVSGEHYAEIGLWFEDRTLCEYDGVFYLPREVGEMLADSGYVVPEDCFA